MFNVLYIIVCLIFLFLLTIALSVLRSSTVFDYPFGFWLPLWFLITSMVFDYPFGFWLPLWFLITPLVFDYPFGIFELILHKDPIMNPRIMISYNLIHYWPVKIVLTITVRKMKPCSFLDDRSPRLLKPTIALSLIKYPFSKQKLYKMITLKHTPNWVWYGFTLWLIVTTVVVLVVSQ